METATAKKPQKSSLKDWREWGKQAYKGCASMMRNNSHHPDYDTPEKRKAIHDANESGTGSYAHNWTEEGRAKLRSRWGYSDEEIEAARQAWVDGYKASRQWYAREDAKYQKILDEYRPLFAMAEEVAKKVDVSDIRDGFPCGWAIVYLDYACRETPLGKALAHFKSDTHTTQYKYELPIAKPNYGQCIAFDERINAEVVKFLRANNVLANSHSVID